MSNVLNNGYDIPEMDDSYVAGLDVFYIDWNEVTFYIEDTDKERYFLNILKRLYPEIRLERIFALNGKNNVISSCESSILEGIIEKQIFIVDLDFDKLLGEKKILRNLVYTKKYSIENYLLHEETIEEVVRNYNPRLKTKHDISLVLNFDQVTENIIQHYSDFTTALYINMEMRLGIPSPNINVNRCFNLKQNNIGLNINEFSPYINQIRHSVGDSDWQECQSKILSNIRNSNDWLSLIPGKLMLNFLSAYLKCNRLIKNIDNDAFFYQLTNLAYPDNFSDLKIKIDSFLN